MRADVIALEPLVLLNNAANAEEAAFLLQVPRSRQRAQDVEPVSLQGVERAAAGISRRPQMSRRVRWLWYVGGFILFAGVALFMHGLARLAGAL